MNIGGAAGRGESSGDLVFTDRGIVVCTNRTLRNEQGVEDIIVRRFGYDGLLDTTFGAEGLAALHLADGRSQRCDGLVSLGSGFGVASTSFELASSDAVPRATLYAIETDGTAATPFGSNGSVAYETDTQTILTAVATHPPADAVYVGLTRVIDKTALVFGQHPNGDFDPAFGGQDGGVISVASGDKTETVAMHVLDDGRLLLAIRYSIPTRQTWLVSRFLP